MRAKRVSVGRANKDGGGLSGLVRSFASGLVKLCVRV